MIRPVDLPGREDVARHYDELDGLYREVWGEHIHHGLWVEPDDSPETAVENLAELVAERAGLKAGSAPTHAGPPVVCDVGCGYGATARHLARRFGARVTGVTVSSVQHARASSGHGGASEVPAGDLRFLLRDWLDNGLPTDHFDAVIAVESISHVEDKLRFLAEARRTLRPGGRFVLAVWLAGEDPGSLERRLLLEPICREGRLPGLASRKEYADWLAEVEFEEATFEDLSDRVRRTWTICLKRVVGRLFRDPEARRYLLDPRATERTFGLSLVRIWVAYRTGALRYGVFTARG